MLLRGTISGVPELAGEQLSNPLLALWLRRRPLWQDYGNGECPRVGDTLHQSAVASFSSAGMSPFRGTLSPASKARIGTCSLKALKGTPNSTTPMIAGQSCAAALRAKRPVSQPSLHQRVEQHAKDVQSKIVPATTITLYYANTRTCINALMTMAYSDVPARLPLAPASAKEDAIAADEPAASEVLEQLARISGSSALQATDRSRRLLDYLVKEVLAGRKARIKAYSIATEVLGRAPSFDPQKDPIVRIEAARLRR